MRESVRKAAKDLYKSPIVRATVAFFILALGANTLVGGCQPPRVEGGRLTFSGTDLEGRPVSPADPRFAGKVLLIDIWGTWCPPCLATIPYFIDFQERFSPQGFEVIGVEFASLRPEMRADYVEYLRKWVKDHGINYTIVQGGDVSEVESFFPDLKSFQGFPTTIMVGRDGRVRSVERGYYPGIDKQYEALITELLRERIPIERKSDQQ